MEPIRGLQSPERRTPSFKDVQSVPRVEKGQRDGREEQGVGTARAGEGSPLRGGAGSRRGRRRSQSPRLFVKSGRAARRRAGSGLTHLALVPSDPRWGDGRGGGRGEREEGARAQWRGEEQGPGSGLRGCERAANPAGGGRLARAPWGRNPGPGKGGGATRRDVGGCSLAGTSTVCRQGQQGERIQSRTPGSLGGSHLGPHA